MQDLHETTFNQWRNLRFEPRGGQSLAERGPLITVGGALNKTQKKLQNDSQSLHVVNVHTRSRIKKFDHISTSLQSLHWLPVLCKPRFKLLCIVFRALHGVGPLYLQELICPYCPTRSLRSESKNFLYVLVFHTATYGNTLFTGETVILWNDLPQEVRDAENLSSFKRLLKTHFLNSACS